MIDFIHWSLTAFNSVELLLSWTYFSSGIYPWPAMTCRKLPDLWFYSSLVERLNCYFLFLQGSSPGGRKVQFSKDTKGEMSGKPTVLYHTEIQNSIKKVKLLAVLAALKCKFHFVLIVTQLDYQRKLVSGGRPKSQVGIWALVTLGKGKNYYRGLIK